MKAVRGMRHEDEAASSQSFCQMSHGVKAARDVVINHGRAAQQKRGASVESRQIEVEMGSL